MIASRRYHWLVAWLVALTPLLSPNDAQAVFVDKPRLTVADVEASVAAALVELAGNQVSLVGIVGVYQPTQTQLNPRSSSVSNVAAILALLNGSVPTQAGPPLVYEEDIEQIICQQLNDNRWLCYFSALSNSLGLPGLKYHFFLEQ